MQSGDCGKDLLGTITINGEKFFIVVQCKNYRSSKIGVGSINEFIGALQDYPDTTFGVFVTSKRDGYSDPARKKAQSTSTNLLLTNIHDMEQDILGYVFKKKDHLYVILAEQTRKLEKQSKIMRGLKYDFIIITNDLYSIIKLIVFSFTVVVFFLFSIFFKK